MPTEKRKLPPVQIPTSAFDAFSEVAKQENKTFSQAVREAMQEYCANRGTQADFSVGMWGGWRERSEK